MTTQKQFTITKRIAKHGRQSVIIVPALLQEYLLPGTLTKITIEIMDLENGKNIV